MSSQSVITQKCSKCFKRSFSHSGSAGRYMCLNIQMVSHHCVEILVFISAVSMGSPAHASTSPLCLMTVRYQLKHIGANSPSRGAHSLCRYWLCLRIKGQAGDLWTGCAVTTRGFPSKIRCVCSEAERSGSCQPNAAASPGPWETCGAGRQLLSRVMVEVQADDSAGRCRPAGGLHCWPRMFPRMVSWMSWQRPSLGRSLLKLKGKCFPREGRRGGFLPNGETQQPRKLLSSWPKVTVFSSGTSVGRRDTTPKAIS